MANKIMCDRCGKLSYDDSRAKRWCYLWRNNSDKFDLCPDCEKAFYDFLRWKWCESCQQYEPIEEWCGNEELQKCVDESVDESVDECHFLCRHNENMRCKIGRNGAKCLKEALGEVGEKE